jgi:integrase
LISQATTTKTARDRLNWVKTLLKYATQDLELIPKNPWIGLEIKTKTTLVRRPWDKQHLTLLFSHDIWQKGIMPSIKLAGGEAAYWIPLLALYTGARLSEICQLEIKNIQTVDGIAVLKITDSGEGQSVKSAAGHRVIPIHSKLLELGFMNYVQSQSGAVLWGKLLKRDGKAGGFFSQFFGGLRKSLGIPPDIVFHSFRHTFRSALAEKGISELIIDRLLGHETPGSVGAKVYTHISVTTLKDATEAIGDILDLKLPALFSI